MPPRNTTVVVVFTSNRSFYLTTAVPPVSVLTPYARDTRSIFGSQTEAEEEKTAVCHIYIAWLSIY